MSPTWRSELKGLAIAVARAPTRRREHELKIERIGNRCSSAATSRLATALVLAFAAGCGDDDAQATGAGAAGGNASQGGAGGLGGAAGQGGAPASGLHLIHAALGAGPVQLCVDGAAVGAETPEGAASAVAGLPPGTYAVRAASPGGCNGLALDVDVEVPTGDTFASVVLYGDGSLAYPYALASSLIDNSYILGGGFRRFFHAAPGVGQLDLGYDEAGTYDPAFGGAPYGGEGKILPIGITGYVGTGPDEGVVLVVRDGLTDAVIATSAPVDFLDLHTYTTVAVGGPGSVDVLLCRDFPSPGCERVGR